MLIQEQRIVRIWLTHRWIRSSGILLTHPHFPQLSSSRPRRRRAVHFSRLFNGECESSRLLFLGCRERPEGLFRGRSRFFCGLRPAGRRVRRPESCENTGKSGRETKNAESGHSRRLGVWYCVLFFRRKPKSSPEGTLFITPRKMSRLFRRRKVLLVNGLCVLPVWQAKGRYGRER